MGVDSAAITAMGDAHAYDTGSKSARRSSGRRRPRAVEPPKVKTKYRHRRGQGCHQVRPRHYRSRSAPMDRSETTAAGQPARPFSWGGCVRAVCMARVTERLYIGWLARSGCRSGRVDRRAFARMAYDEHARTRTVRSDATRRSCEQLAGTSIDVMSKGRVGVAGA